MRATHLLFFITSTMIFLVFTSLYTSWKYRKMLRSREQVRSWYRCAICGVYSQTTCNCLGRKGRRGSALHMPLSPRQQRRLLYHLEGFWCLKRSKSDQERFLAYALKLEDLSQQEWSSYAISQIYALLPLEIDLPGFLAFYQGLEKIYLKGPLDPSGVAKLYLSTQQGEYQDFSEKIW